MPVALITGITGQDGHYLLEVLLARRYEVIGISRQASRLPPRPGLVLRDVDITDAEQLERVFSDFDIDEVYNLAGPSFGPDSWTHPVATIDTLGTSVIQILEFVQQARRPIRFFQASSSELFGIAKESPQSELTRFAPVTPYGFAKLMAHAAVDAYRVRHGLFAVCGILFNHESPLRRPEFVTRKVTREVARIRAGLSTELRIGSLDAYRDWSFAGDFAEAMWRTLQAPQPDDYVLASGTSHSVREWCDAAFAHVGFDYRDYVKEEARLVRQADFDRVGDASKAACALGWSVSTSFRELVGMMVDRDVKKIEQAAEGDSEC